MFLNIFKVSRFFKVLVDGHNLVPLFFVDGHNSVPLFRGRVWFPALPFSMNFMTVFRSLWPAINSQTGLGLLSSTTPQGAHTEKYLRNHVKSTRNQIVFIIFRLIWIQTDVLLDPNQSENGKYNLISVWFYKISKRFLCVQEVIY